MSLIEWSEQFLTGHPVIDHQHQALFEQINELERAAIMGCSEAELFRLAEQVRLSTQEHFRCEEQMMMEQHFPGLEAHRQEHQEILRNGEALMEQYQHGNARLSETIPSSLRSWALQHILDEDLQLAEFMRQRARH